MVQISEWPRYIPTCPPVFIYEVRARNEEDERARERKGDWEGGGRERVPRDNNRTEVDVNN